jgi:four helix bundle protein
MRNFRKYDIWIDSMKLVNTIYDIAVDFPIEEKFALILQMTRSAVSIPYNIAEGASRKSEKDFGRFLEISLGSAYELETQLIIADNRKYINKNIYSELIEQIINLQKRISALRNGMIKKN